MKIIKTSMPNYVPATIEDGVEPREEPLELLDGKRARLVAEVGAGQGERAARAEAAHLADEGVVGDPGMVVVIRLPREFSYSHFFNHSIPFRLRCRTNAVKREVVEIRYLS